MTTKNAHIFYYSLTGKTEALIESLPFNKTRLNAVDTSNFDFGDSEIIMIGCPTYGRGAPPIFFKGILKQIKSLSNRKIVLFGSGNTIYGEDYCGALDVLEELLSKKNIILSKFKFEGYPTENTLAEFERILKSV